MNEYVMKKISHHLEKQSDPEQEEVTLHRGCYTARLLDEINCVVIGGK